MIANGERPVEITERPIASPLNLADFLGTFSLFFIMLVTALALWFFEVGKQALDSNQQEPSPAMPSSNTPLKDGYAVAF